MLVSVVVDVDVTSYPEVVVMVTVVLWVIVELTSGSVAVEVTVRVEVEVWVLICGEAVTVAVFHALMVMVDVWTTLTIFSQTTLVG